MAFDIGAALAALGGGASALGTSMDQNRLEAERLRRQRMADALSLLAAKSEYGLSEVPQGQTPEDAMKAMAINDLLSKGPGFQYSAGQGGPGYKQGKTYTEQQKDLAKTQEEYGPRSVVQIGDQQYIQTPWASKEARTQQAAERKAQAAELARQDYERLKSSLDYARQRELKGYEASLRGPQSQYEFPTINGHVTPVSKFTGQPLPSLGRGAPNVGEQLRADRNEQSLADAGAWFTIGMQDPTKASQLVSTFQQLRQVPQFKDEQDPRVIYRAMMNGMRSYDVGAGLEARTKAVKDKATKANIFAPQIEQSTGGTTPSGKPSGTPSVAPMAKPAMTPTASEWDRLVQVFGTKAITDKYGPRPGGL